MIIIKPFVFVWPQRGSRSAGSPHAAWTRPSAAKQKPGGTSLNLLHTSTGGGEGGVGASSPAL